MLDEFPALGRLDFFESALAFMAGYGLKSFLIAQSLNQIEKAYGQNNAILDNCHVRVSFATNDERTAKRVSDALGTATEIRDAKNYAGHRLSPWLGHLMVSRQETARPLLTPGEVMQLPPSEELVLVAGCPPIRARKARYFADRRLAARILPPPVSPTTTAAGAAGAAAKAPDDWSGLAPIAAAPDPGARPREAMGADKGGDGGLRWEAEPDAPDFVVPGDGPPGSPELDPAPFDLDGEGDALAALQAGFRRVARQAALDPDDGLGL
jgi:type IV secretion system protein VirD4